MRNKRYSKREEERSFGNTLFGQTWFQKRLSTPSTASLFFLLLKSKRFT